MSDTNDPDHPGRSRAEAGGEDVCLCLHVPLSKLVAFLIRERPIVASQLSQCNGAGTGCGWCVPYLQELFEQWKKDPSALDTVPWDGEEYRRRRAEWRRAQGTADPPPEGPIITDDIVLEDELER